MPAMNPEIKAQWTAALRSGEYRQGAGALSRNGTYCCLGVLCDLAVKADVIPAPTEYTILGDSMYGDEREDLHLPAEVMEWAGIADASPEIDPDALPEGAQWSSDPADAAPSLANLNDSGTPFAVIADIIDAQL